jgi:predicted metal-dependent peptidase
MEKAMTQTIVDITALNPEPQPVHIIVPDKHVMKLFDDSMAYLVFKWQLFSQMIYSGMELTYTDSVPIAATDSKNIFLNPEGFLDHGIDDVPQIAYVHGHEVGHRFFNDIVLMMAFEAMGFVDGVPYDHDTYNRAADYRINALLSANGIGRRPECALYDPTLASTGDESVVEIYKKLWKSGQGGKPRPGNQPQGSMPGQGNSKIILPPGHGNPQGQTGFDRHLRPSKETVQKDKGKREQEIVAAVQVAQRLQGTIPGAIQRIVNEITNPTIPWQDHLKTTMIRKAGDPKLDWRHLNRRLAGRDPSLYFAKRGHKGAGLIMVAADNSGSIGNKEISVFSGEMTGIVADLNPRELMIYWCDSAITRTDRLDEPTDLTALFVDWKKKGVGGGGGTDFRPVFEAIDKLDDVPDMLVFFTDGYGTYPATAPDYPVIWASITDYTYPWGDVVRVKL